MVSKLYQAFVYITTNLKMLHKSSNRVSAEFAIVSDNNNKSMEEALNSSREIVVNEHPATSRNQLSNAVRIIFSVVIIG